MKAKARAVVRTVVKHRVFFLFVMGLFTVGLLAGSYAVQTGGATGAGQAQPGDHDWWQDQGTTGFCERCHADIMVDISTGPHAPDWGATTDAASGCSFCHTPGSGQHAASAATCADCHDGGFGGVEAGELAIDAHAGILTDLGEQPDGSDASKSCQSCHTHVAVNITVANQQAPLELIMGN